MIRKLNILKVAYLAHPVGGDVLANLAKAKRWVRWLEETHLPHVAINAPWITECEIWDDDDPQQRADGMARDREIMIRCDLIILAGGKISNGMAGELRAAKLAGMEVIDLTHLGEEPPVCEICLDLGYVDGGSLGGLITCPCRDAQ